MIKHNSVCVYKKIKVLVVVFVVDVLVRMIGFQVLSHLSVRPSVGCHRNKERATSLAFTYDHMQIAWFMGIRPEEKKLAIHFKPLIESEKVLTTPRVLSTTSLSGHSNRDLDKFHSLQHILDTHSITSHIIACILYIFV